MFVVYLLSSAVTLFTILLLISIVFGMPRAQGEEYTPMLEVTGINALVGSIENPKEQDIVWTEYYHPGEQLTLVAHVVNHSQKQVSYVLVFEVRYHLGITESVGWKEAEISPGESSFVALNWRPIHQGAYEVRVFAISDLRSLDPFSELTHLRYFYVRPDRDYRPEVALTITEDGMTREYSGVEGAFGYLGYGEAGFIIPKEVIEVKKGDRGLLGVRDTVSWSTNVVKVHYPLLLIGEDIVIVKEFSWGYDADFSERFYEERHFKGPEGYLDPFPTERNEYSYVFDVPEGEYLLIADVGYHYVVASTNVGVGLGQYFFRINVT